MLPTKFRFIWQSGFRGEDFLEINQSEARNKQSLYRTFQGCFLPNFDSFGQAVRGEDFLEINQSETRIACGGHVY
jgi:hypothetical protein